MKLHKYLEKCGEWVEETNGDRFYIFNDNLSPYFRSVLRHLNCKLHSFITIYSPEEIMEEHETRKIIIRYSSKNNNYLVRYVVLCHIMGGGKKILNVNNLYSDCDNFVKRFNEIYGCR